MIARLGVLLLCAPLLASCQTTGPASVSGGECRVFERPDYAVLGKRQYDQDWIDSQVEGGVGGCGWKRPNARPASFDAQSPTRVAVPARAKKRGMLKRIKDRVAHPFTAPSPSAAPVIEPAPVVAPPPPVVKPVPRDRVDELLHPSK